MRAALVLSLAATMVACGDGRRATRRDASVPPEAAAPRVPPGHGLEVERLPPERPVTRIVGLVRDGAVVMLASDARRDVAPGVTLETEQTGLVLDVGRSGRVTVAAGARVELGELTDAELFVREGTVQASQPAEGNSSRPALRLATPRGVVTLTSGGEALVVVPAQGPVFVGSWSGVTELHEGRDAEDGVVRPRLLVGGGVAELGGEARPPNATPAGEPVVEAVVREAATRFSSRRARGARTCDAEVESAQGTLRALAERRVALEQLRRRHATLTGAQPPRVDEARVVARDIIAQTQAVLRERERTLLYLERAHACEPSRERSRMTPVLPQAKAVLDPESRP